MKRYWADKGDVLFGEHEADTGIVVSLSSPDEAKAVADALNSADEAYQKVNAQGRANWNAICDALVWARYFGEKNLPPPTRDVAAIIEALKAAQASDYAARTELNSLRLQFDQRLASRMKEIEDERQRWFLEHLNEERDDIAEERDMWRQRADTNVRTAERMEAERDTARAEKEATEKKWSDLLWEEKKDFHNQIKMLKEEINRLQLQQLPPHLKTPMERFFPEIKIEPVWLDDGTVQGCTSCQPGKPCYGHGHY